LKKFGRPLGSGDCHFIGEKSLSPKDWTDLKIELISNAFFLFMCNSHCHPFNGCILAQRTAPILIGEVCGWQ